MRRPSPVAWLVWAGLFVLATPSLAAEAGSSGVDAAAGAVRSDPIDLEGLMKLLASSGGVRARFHQTRTLSLLEDSIETSGVLYFVPPDTLARHTTQPGRSSVVVRHSTVTFRDETGEQVVQLASSEVAQAIVGNLVVILRGDLAGLRARYHVEFRPTRSDPVPSGDISEEDRDDAWDGWELDLVPRSKRVRAIIERVRFAGQRNAIARVETHEANGDQTVDQFSDVAVGLEWDAEAYEQIFSLDAPGDAP